MNNKARLLVTNKCDRDCPGCCNKDWKGTPARRIDSLKDLEKYEEIIITGGEPTWFNHQLCELIEELIVMESGSPLVYLYTASPKGLAEIPWGDLDGVTLTLHDQKAAEEFVELQAMLKYEVDNELEGSFRLHVFKGVTGYGDTKGWKVKKDLVWIKDCPLPAGEEFLTLPSLFEDVAAEEEMINAELDEKDYANGEGRMHG